MMPGLRRRAPAMKAFRGSGKDRGAVTAEFAVALPAVLLLLALLLAGSAAGITQLRLEEAARAGARALARGEDAGAVEGIVRQLAGASASSSVVADGEWVSVTVSGRVSGPVGSIVPWTLSARALARGETAESARLRPQEAWPVRAPTAQGRLQDLEAEAS
ncbi:pilus assembly protein TadE [Arthrobacter sp. Leaf337]|uniref:TadE family type IV pilus minor pilin n=1 Tax=Arthrobacter sp. Leaf337 TaxID=1736342 RepID=UPI0006F481D8|nr:pilus assembly protein TadE [Arthrobacter sp. Leaf337]